jgi:hypothetical protein
MISIYEVMSDQTKTNLKNTFDKTKTNLKNMSDKNKTRLKSGTIGAALGAAAHKYGRSDESKVKEFWNMVGDNLKS